MLRRCLLLTLFLVTAVWLCCPIRPAIVLGDSMEPTLHNGQLVAINRVYYRRHAIRRGDIIIFRHDGMAQVKRVCAVAGARVYELRCHDTGSVFLIDPPNLERIRRETASAPGAHAAIVERVVPAGTIYVLGDGGNISYDSRNYGPVPVAAVLGRVLFDRRDASGNAAIARATL